MNKEVLNKAAEILRRRREGWSTKEPEQDQEENKDNDNCDFGDQIDFKYTKMPCFKIPVDKTEKYREAYLKKMDRRTNKLETHYGSETKASVLSESQCCCISRGNIIEAFVEKKTTQLRGKKILTSQQRLDILKSLTFEKIKRNPHYLALNLSEIYMAQTYDVLTIKNKDLCQCKAKQ
ncbi:unnamed protein product [Moneuplotes crassus]|uniref:Uncharacterized protein n=1 Tax=Euplotes crassus TaxID=5936 RepID=A0AAD1U6C9_EUPCR|nr:unnamed protein product [Moneuplotes crassus]